MSNPTGSNASGSAPPLQGPPRMYDISFLDDDGSNFTFWRFHIQMVLGLRDLWGLVDGSVAAPDVSQTGTRLRDNRK